MKKNAIFFAPGAVLLLIGAAAGGLFFGFGGAAFDGVSPALLFSPFSAVVLLPLFAGLALIFSGISRRFFEERCSLETKRFALGISAVAALGTAIYVYGMMWNGFMGTLLISWSRFYSIVAAAEIPCLVAIAVLVYLYMRKRKAQPSGNGVLIELITAVLYYPLFFFGIGIVFWSLALFVG